MIDNKNGNNDIPVPGEVKKIAEVGEEFQMVNGEW